MDAVAILDDEALIKRIKSCVKNFYLSTGVCCSFIDNNGSFICRSEGFCEHECFCSKAGILNKGSGCKDVHLYGKLQGERFGGKYIYFCPAGFTFFISPVSMKEEIIGALLGGPILMFDRQEYLESEITRKFKVKSNNISIIKKILNEIPEISPEKVSGLSETLFTASFYIGFYSDGLNQISKNNLATTQQGEISEFIHQLKQSNDETLPAYPLDKEKELLSSITDGDKQNASRLLNEILGYIFFSSGGSFEVIRARVLELIILLSRAALSGGADIENIFGLNYKYISEINKFKNVDDLCFWLSEIMNNFISNMFKYNEVKHIDVIYKATEFIRRNFMKKITLDDVASYVYLSPSYFSKIFKDEMKCNFNTYLNKIRIEHSISLLLSENVKLVDVAGMVGFEDQSYFTKVFKKLTGMTPKNYQETRGKKKAKIFSDETHQQ